MDPDALTRRSTRAFTLAWASLSAFWGLIVLSVVAGAVLTREAQWWRLALSHFGALGERSMLAYDGLNLAASAAMFVLAFALPIACEPLERSGRLRRGARIGLGVVAGLLGACLVLVALLPTNLPGPSGPTVHLVHDYAGWNAAIIPGVSMLLVMWAVRGLSPRFYAFTVVCLVPLVVASFLWLGAGVLAHGLAEIVVYGVIGVWMFALLAQLDRAVNALRV